ncbi:hypothetical protein PILCRDRAFT_83262 [Piloderma croceum F 1598]|uniref:Uncharacterized protein n=1 Tax=Piloderma croceum (strain F 1598) TaxID=765440 RepID=A0A0C3CQC8_PILCF|nr:hypothetical protein PILCRDRAFT_83262 [Piloderma croceum F 1598]
MTSPYAKRNQEIALNCDGSLVQKTSFKTSNWGSLSLPLHQAPAYMQITSSLQNADTQHPVVTSSPDYTSPSSPQRASLRQLPAVHEPDNWEDDIVGLSRRVSAQRTATFLRNSPLEMHRGASIRRAASLWRSNSVDTASVYSCASAPIDAHEYMFQPIALEPTPSSAPGWIVYPNHLQRQQSEAQLSIRNSTTIREELAPETYAKCQLQRKPLERQKPQFRWKAQPAHNRLRTVSESSGILPVSQMSEDMHLSLIRPPSAALRIHPDHLLSESLYATSESLYGTAFPVVPPGLWPAITSTSSIPPKVYSNTHTPPNRVLPELPPRSPTHEKRGYERGINVD